MSQSGFVPRRELAVILGYDPAYSFRGFGEQHSGLKKISEEEFKAIVERFNQAQPINLPEHPISPEAWKRWGTGEESDTHRKLKEFVAANPELALDEPGLCTLKVEYSFASGDRADIVLVDRFNRIVAIEIEPEVNASDEVGALQAIKYRFMLEWCTDRSLGDSRAILIAPKIHAKIRKKCAAYGVECYEISREEVTS
jgi:RecB family endonuclease NucS